MGALEAARDSDRDFSSPARTETRVTHQTDSVSKTESVFIGER